MKTHHWFTLYTLLATLFFNYNSAFSQSTTNEFKYSVVPNASNSENFALGTIEGKFDVTEFGNALYTIPLNVESGVANMQPNLSISYNSNMANGMLGYGFSLSGMSVITRGPKTIYHDNNASGASYSLNDAFYLDGKRLIQQEYTDGADSIVYCLEDNKHARIVLHGIEKLDERLQFFTVNLNNGIIYEYGRNNGQQRFSPTYSSRWFVNSWYITKAVDAKGNYIDYEYFTDQLCLYPQYIRYGGNLNNNTSHSYYVQFDYELRNDIVPIILKGYNGEMRYRLKSISSGYYRTYELGYDTLSDCSAYKYSRLVSVTECKPSGEEATPIMFSWNFIPDFEELTSTPTFAYHNGSNSQDLCYYTSGDMNGDGLSDIIETIRIEDGENSYINNVTIHYAKKEGNNVNFATNSSIRLSNDYFYDYWTDYRTAPMAVDLQGDGINELIIPHRLKNSSEDYVEFQYINNYDLNAGQKFDLSGKDFIYDAADLNNDGRCEILVIQKGSGGTGSAAIVGINEDGSNFMKMVSLSISSDAIGMHLSDMNQDGMVDAIIFYSDRYSIYYNDGNWLEQSTSTSIAISASSDLPINACRSYISDFNGDGVADYLLTSYDNSTIYLAEFKGNDYFNFTDITPNDNSGIGSEFTDIANYHIYDFDGDHLTDVIVNKYTYHKKKTSTYWYRSNGTSLEFVKKATSLKYNDVLNQLFVIGDFNGDGLCELMNKGYECYNSEDSPEDAQPSWYIYFNNNDNAKAGKVAAITNSLGATINIEYKPLTDNDVYTPQKYDITYPVVDMNIPLPVVSSITSTGGAVVDDTITYKYKGIRIHLQGKGILGMVTHEQCYKNQEKIFTKSKKNWSDRTFLPYTIEEITSIGDLEHKKEYFYSGAIYGNVISYMLNWARTTDYDNFISTSHYFYNEKDLPIEEMHCSEFDLHTTVNYYEDYVYKGYKYVPLKVKKGKYYEGHNELFIQTTVYEYNNQGLQSSIIENFGSGNPLTTAYSYDIYGNIKSKSLSGTGVNVSTEYYDYDYSNRFLKRKYTTTYPKIKITYNYDIWNNLTSITDSTRTSSPQTTTYTYDVWGNKTSETLPTGQKKTITRGCGNSMAQRYYVLEQGTAMPWKKTWYDVQGREVKQESVGANDVLIAKTFSYNNDGKVSQIANTVGDITTTDYFTYDTRGRVLSEYSNTGRRRSYSYNGNTVTSTINGNSYSTTYDSWGNAIETTGPDGNMSYMYHSCGKPISVTSNGATVTMEYDDCGNQTKLIDPDAGTMTYTYDALGRITTEKDARGNTTTYSYNKFNKVAAVKVNNDYQTSYSYSIWGNNTGLLSSITCKSQGTYKIDYTYDAYNRVTKEVHNIPNSGIIGSDVTYKYTYNTDGLLETKTYPGNVIIRYTYDSYGNKISTSLNGQNVWALQATDGYETTVNRGQNLSSTERLDMNGYLVYSDITKNGTPLHQMSYTYNAYNGNVLSRTGMYASKEDFTYDNADRLTGVSGGMTAEYRYAPNGNITFKTGIGNYTYDSPKPHAVTGVENTNGLIDKSSLYTTYNSIGKISTIHDVESGYKMNFSYGPDYARCDALLSNGFDTIQHITYLPDCDVVSEKDQDGEYFHQWYYYIGDGVLYYRDSYENTNIYYTFTDNLGSILRLYDGDGNEFFAASYDPWGWQSIAHNNIGFIRGYTGHEHLPYFDLINMNGRLYDPLVGRFLSTDNFVQEPLNAQNFNRYSYCLNNPLKYNDPCGEWFGIDDLFVGIAGFAFGYIYNGITSGDWGWSSVKQGFVSAVSTWIGFNSCGIGSATDFIGLSYVNNVANSLMPNLDIPIGDIGISISPGIGLGAGGLNLGLTNSVYYNNGDHSLSLSYGCGNYYSGMSIHAGVDDWVFGYSLTSYKPSNNGGNYLGSQRVGTYEVVHKKFSVKVSNDMKYIGDNHDRWRTSAVELSLGDYSIGTLVNTNDGKLESNGRYDGTSVDPIVGKHLYGLGAWKNGEVYNAPIWFGYANNNSICRIGYSSKTVQSLTQNLVHKFMKTPYFMNYNNFKSGAFYYSGYNNPFSLWNY